MVRITVPVAPDGQKSDPSRPVTFLSTPAFAVATDIEVPISPEVRWPELGGRQSIRVDISYGGAYYAIIAARELGFVNGLKNVNLEAVTHCICKLKPYLGRHPYIVSNIEHPEDERLSFL
jgi:trans-L-3-hydroxyproline dehydratase